MTNWHLLPGEKEIFETETSWKVFLKFYLLTAGAVGLSIAGFFGFLGSFMSTTIIGSVFLIAAIIFFLKATLKRRQEKVLITNDRVLIRKGTAFAKQTNVEAISYNNLINVSVEQTRSQKLLNVGNVHFKLSGEEHIMTDINDPYGIERAVYKIIEKEKEIGKKQQ